MSKGQFIKVILIIVIIAVFFSLILTLIVEKKGVISGDRVALIRIEGVILSSKDVIEQIKKYDKDPTVKAIVLRIDSPGGGVVPAQEIYEEVKKIRDKNRKKVVASIGSMAASGGYYIACASEKIVANSGSITGGIGVILELANIEKLMEKIGVKSVVVKSGRYKDIGSIFKEMSAEERKLLQGVIDDVHQQFIDAVVEGRKLKKEDVVLIADGRIFTGKQAKEMKLVDNLGTLEDTIKLAAELSGIKGEPKVVTEEKKPGILSILRGIFIEGISKDYPQRKVNLQYIYSP